MKDVDITDQGPDTGNNDIAVLRGGGMGEERGAGEGVKGGGEGGAGSP